MFFYIFLYKVFKAIFVEYDCCFLYFYEVSNKCVLSFLQVEAIKSGLHASLLVSHPETAELFVNFDPQILTLIRETECMSRLGLEIPLAARAIRQKQGTFKNNFNKLKVGNLTYLSVYLLFLSHNSVKF